MHEVREFSVSATVAAAGKLSLTLLARTHRERERESSCVLHFKIYRYPKTLHPSKMQIVFRCSTVHCSSTFLVGKRSDGSASSAVY